MTDIPAASCALSPVTEPSRRVGKRWIALIALANLGLYLGYFAPLGVLLPNQVQAIAGPSGKVAAFGWVVGAGAAVAMISNPVAGALSDRTTGRFGRRHPWTVGGALAGAAALVLLAGQHTIAGVIIGWCLAQAGLNAMQASIAAGLPTRTSHGPGWPGSRSTSATLWPCCTCCTSCGTGSTTVGKDLCIINIASSAPQVLAPAIAAPLVSRLGGYPTLYLSVAVITVLGSVFVLRVRSVP